MFKEYDVPLDPDSNLPANFVQNDGSDWSLGTPSNTNGRTGVHDAQADLDGNLWYTYSYPSRTTTVGRIDAKTGQITDQQTVGFIKQQLAAFAKFIERLGAKS